MSAQVLCAAHDRRRVIALALATVDDSLLDALHGVLGQKLQYPDEMAGAGTRAMLALQGPAQLREYRRQLPIAVDVGVVQRRRLARKRHQIVQRIEHLLIVIVRAPVPRDDLAAGHDLHVPHIRLDGHTLKSVHARYTVAITIEAHRLVLVHAGRLLQTGIESPCRQGQGLGTLALEALADRLFLPCLLALAIAQTAGMQMRIELVAVVDHRHRRRPSLLQELHAPLGTRLLLRTTYQAEERLKVVVAR